MRSRTFITFFTSALLLSASLFLAPAAFAADPDTCDNVLEGSTKVNSPSGSATIDGGIEGTADDASINWSGTTLNYTVPTGGTLQICLKAGAESSGGGTEIYTVTGTGSLSTTTDLNSHGISHISYIYTFVPPSDQTTATASIGDVACGDDSVDVTLGTDGTSDFTVTVGSVTENFSGVTGSGNTETIDLSSLSDGTYTVTVSSDDLAADVTKSITLESDCGSPAVRSASLSGSCEAGVTVHARGQEDDEFTVHFGDVLVDTIVLGSNGVANERYDLPEDEETTVSVAGAASAIRTFDCTVEVEDVVNERPADNTTDPADPADPVVVDVDEVEVKPRVLEREQLAFTGENEDRLLVIALALMGLGLPLTLVKPKWQRINER